MPSPSQTTTFREKSRDYFGRLKETVQTITRNPELVGLLIVYVVMMRVHFLMERPFAGPYLTSLGFSYSQLGFLFMFYYCVMSLFMLGSARIRAWALGQRTRRDPFSRHNRSICAVVFVNASLMSIVILGMLGIYVMIGLLHPSCWKASTDALYRPSVPPASRWYKPPTTRSACCWGLHWAPLPIILTWQPDCSSSNGRFYRS